MSTLPGERVTIPRCCIMSLAKDRGDVGILGFPLLKSVDSSRTLLSKSSLLLLMRWILSIVR